MDFKLLSDNNSDIIYIADTDTHELVYMNKAAIQIFGISDFAGRKCHSVLMQKNTPCQYCPIGSLSPEKDSVVRSYNAVADKYFTFYAKAAEIDGRQCCYVVGHDDTELALALKRTEADRSSSQSGIAPLSRDEKLFECVKHIYSLPSSLQAINYLIAQTGEMLSADRTALFEENDTAFMNSYEWRKSGAKCSNIMSVDLRMLERWMPHFRAGSPLYCSNTETLMADFPNEYSLLSRHGVNSFIISGLNIRGRISAFLFIENPCVEYNAQFPIVSTLSFFFTTSICRRDYEVRQRSSENSYEELYKRFKSKSDEQDKFYNTVPAGVTKNLIDGHMTLLWANDYYYKIHGYTKEEYHSRFTDEHTEDVIYPEDRQLMHTTISNAIMGNRRNITQAFRIVSKSGEIKWIMLRGIITDDVISGFPVVYTVMTDVTETKKLEQALDAERERYKIALASSSDIIFEYDIASDVFTSYGWLSDSDQPSHNMKSVYSHFLSMLKQGDFTHPDDISSILDFIQGNIRSELEVRIIPRAYLNGGNEKKYIWAAISGTILYDGHRSVKVIGKIRNNDTEKLKEMRILEESYRDKLTGMYNRSYGLSLIEGYLGRSGSRTECILMTVDIDELNVINARYGYMFGDTVISAVAELLQGVMSETDIGVRLGGDEFLLLLCNTSRAQGYEIGSLICDQVRYIYTGEDKSLTVSCSIGMASTDDAGGQFAPTFSRALATMQRIKTYGRGNAACYMDLIENDSDCVEDDYYSKYMNDIVSDIYTSGDDDIISFAFGILERTKDLRSAIHVLLLRISKEFRLCDIRIIKADMLRELSAVEYQWSNSSNFDVYSENDFMTKTGYASWREHFENSDNVLEIPANEIVDSELGIRSQLACLSYTEDTTRGLVVYSSQFLRKWSEDEKHLLKEIGRILYTHINRAEAITANKAKTDFLSRMSHEIRTPMNAIMGMTTIARNTLGDSDKTLDCINKIERSTNYLLTLVNDILDMSKIESGKMQTLSDSFDLDNLVTDLWLLHSPVAENKGITLEFQRLYHDTKLMGDSLHLNQIMVNIIGNALKFTPNGGKVTVRFEQLNADSDDTLAVIRFSVRDTGIGISKDNLSKVFNAFEQAESSTVKQYGGTGLGLAISSNLVKMMGSELKLESTPGAGSCFHFTVTLPHDEEAIAAQTGEKKALPTVKSSYDFTGKRILLAEDDDLNVEIAQCILELAGFDVSVARDGREAVERFVCSAENEFDAILMDIRMPIMEGTEATRRIRKLSRQDAKTVPIIAMTANAFDEDIRVTKECGMTEHLSKPINSDVMFRTIEKLINKERI